MIVRVFVNPDGTVRVMVPAKGTSLDNAMARTPHVKNLPFFDIDDRDLPPRSRRGLWRSVAGKVLG